MILTILLMILMSSLWGIILVDDLLKLPEKMYSKYLIIDLVIKLFKCPLCASAHLFWISYLIIYGSLFGFILCPIPYFLTFLLKKYLFNIL
jgi:hypothetical protein